MGCGLCAVHCVVAHSRSRDPVKAFNQETPRPQPRLRLHQRGETCFAVPCRHCNEPWCVSACPTGATRQDPASGTVAVTDEKCIGCWSCVLACPNGAITRDLTRRVAVRCDLCPGLAVPACVANCPNGALRLVTDEAAVEAAAK